LGDEVHSITGPPVDPQFGDPSTDRPDITGITQREAPYPHQNPDSRLKVSEPFKPVLEGRRLANLNLGHSESVYLVGYICQDQGIRYTIPGYWNN
jgi:hypothetical protein